MKDVCKVYLPLFILYNFLEQTTIPGHGMRAIYQNKLMHTVSKADLLTGFAVYARLNRDFNVWIR